MTQAPLDGVRVVEVTLLEPGQLGMILGSLGADVVKVEAPGVGDSARQVGWPWVDGVSLLHRHVNQAKRSITLDLRVPEGAAVFRDLARDADVVISGMRPGALDRRGVGYRALAELNPALVFCELSGYGATGPYRDLPSHGVGFDAWAGCTPPAVDEEGLAHIPAAPVIGSRVGPVWAAAAVLAGVLRARTTGRGCEIDVAQADAAAYTNWIVPEGNRAYQRPSPEVTGHPADDGARRPPGLGGSREAVRYQYYRSSDGHILFMASEREFWRNFCVAVGREDLYDRRPGKEFGDHATGDRQTRRELQEIFSERTTAEWVALGDRADTPIAPVHDGHTLLDDPHFRHRFPWLPAAVHGADLMPIPVHYRDEALPAPRPAPTNGQHTREVLRDLGYDDDRITALLASGAAAEVAE